MTTRNKRLTWIFATVATLLLIPLVAMQFTSEVNWTFSDFVVMGVLLLGTGLLCELTIRMISNLRYRILAVVAILVLFFLVWAELAVGIFDTPFAGS